MARGKTHLRGLIFDIDGTLIDSNELHVRAWKEAFADFGKRFTLDTIRPHIGKGGDLLVPDLLSGREMQRFGEKLKAHRSRLFRKRFIDRVRPFPGIADYFQHLRDRGIDIVLASSSDRKEVNHFIKLLEVGKLIKGATTKQDAVFSKPSPEIFTAAAKVIGHRVEHLLTVGDSPYDVAASHRACMPIAAVLCGGFDRRVLKKAEFIFKNVKETTERVDEIEAWLESDRVRP